MTRFAPGTSQATMDAVNERMYGTRPAVMPARPPMTSGMGEKGGYAPDMGPRGGGMAPYTPQRPLPFNSQLGGGQLGQGTPATMVPRPPMGGYGGMMGMGLGQMFGMGGGYGRPQMPMPQYGGGFGNGFGGGFPGMGGYGRPPMPPQMNPFGFGGGFNGGYGRPPMPQYGGFGMGFGGGFGGYQPQQPQYGGYGGYGGMRTQPAQPQYQNQTQAYPGAFQPPQQQSPFGNPIAQRMGQAQQSPFGSPMRMY